MAKKPITVDEILANLPDDGKTQPIKETLNLIREGAIWGDEELVDLFRIVPNAVSSKTKAWLPRHIQVEIGKVLPIKVVCRQPRTQSSRKKALYQTLEDYQAEIGADKSVELLVVDAYLIHCACGESFIGKEPEHQIQCDLCKSKQRSKSTHRSAKDELTSQVETMFRILKLRNLSSHVKGVTLNILKKKVKEWGLTDDEVYEVFKKEGYSREQFDAIE